MVRMGGMAHLEEQRGLSGGECLLKSPGMAPATSSRARASPAPLP